MVVRMMSWRPWPSTKIEAKITIYRIEGVKSNVGLPKLGVEIKWKGSKKYLRGSEKRNYTKEEGLQEGGFVEFNEGFSNICRFQGINKEGTFRPWEVTFTLLNSLNEGTNNKISPVATASLNLSDFASVNKEKELDLSIPLCVHGDVIECSPSLCLSLSFLELRAAQEYMETVQRSVVSSPSSAHSSETLSPGKGEVSAIKAGLKKVRILTSYISTQRAKKEFREEEGSDGKISDRSDNADYNYPFDTDSLDELDEEESEEGKEIIIAGRKSDSNGPLAYSSFARTLFYSTANRGGDDDLVYYSNRRSDNEGSSSEDLSSSLVDQLIRPSSKFSSILPWRKRKLSFRSPKNKGEPLLKKDCLEEGGDDIDFDRRQFSSSDESSFGWHNEDSIATRSSISEFGDDGFVIGSWESKEIISRDGHLKLQTQVFFASIDQMSERAAGESACTALVAVIADWFQSNPGQMPIKSQLDSLIREGSSVWRNLCDNDAYKEQFPDKHFDLDTVLDAKIRPLCVIPEKSFIGFFHPEGLEEIKGFAFLKDAMSFDDIWEEISQFGSENTQNGDPVVYIVSWNDHFFVLKVEQEAYYIIDTLGERLYEGCSQAYILKFDRDTTIQDIPKENQSSADKKLKLENPKPENPKEERKEGAESVVSDELLKSKEEKEPVFCSGKKSCKEYIKSFLAAIPIRELQVDLKKGLMESTPLHHRLQIELHYTKYLEPVFQFPSLQGSDDAQRISAMAVI